MADIKINYNGLKRTGAIDSKIKEKFSRLDRLLTEGAKIIITVKDQTPNKKTTIREYEILAEIRNIEFGKNEDYIVTHKDSDLYAGIDKLIDKAESKLSKSHDKKIIKLRKVKELFSTQYKKLMNKMQKRNRESQV